MDDLDRKIEEALSAEDRSLHAKFGEQGIFGQWFGVYDGAMRGMAIFATILTFALFFAAVYCGWKFFGAAEAIEAARWGAGAVMLMIMVGFLKLWFWMRMESNRILREVKRLELQIVRSRTSG
jgi:hypothetical protein